MTALPPSGAGIFAAEFPEVWKAYEALGAACATAGPLDARTRRLIKLALSIGAGSEGAVHSHARQGLEADLSKEEVMQVAALAITTLGFPRAMAAMSWVRDVVSESGSS